MLNKYMEDDRENFNKWVQQWEIAEKEIAQELANTKPQQRPDPPRTSYFTGSPSEYDFVDDGQPTDDWRSIYQRAVEVDFNKDDLITDGVNIAYMGSEGYGQQNIPPVAQPSKSGGGKKVYTNNPIHFSSAGNDQEGDNGLVRVSNNWSDGEELRELDAIKRQVEAIERKFHEADVLDKKSERSKFESQLKNLRNRITQLSEKLTSNPTSDLA